MSNSFERLSFTPEQNRTLLNVTGIKISRVSSQRATCHCPYHKDKTPSMHVHLGKGIYRCFSCKRSGTLPQLVYDLTGHGARYYIKEGQGQRSEFSFKGDSLEAMTRMAEVYYNEISPVEKLQLYKDTPAPTIDGHLIPWHKSNDVKRWMESRKIPEKTANDWAFQFGMKIFLHSNYKEDPDDDDSEFTSYKRLIVPLHGPEGNPLSIEARSIDGSNPKTLYIRPMDFLFRYSHLDISKPLYLCEGLVDAARLYPYRKNVTYLFGSTVGDVKTHLLRKFPKIILIPDNDEAGFKLARTLVEKKLTITLKKIPKQFEDLGDTNMSDEDIRHWLRNNPPMDLGKDPLGTLDLMIQKYRRLKELEHV